MRAAAAALLLLVGCTDPEDDDRGHRPRDRDTAADTGGGDDTDTALTADDMPADPSPFTVTTAGDMSGSLAFDLPSCTAQGSNFRMFWRNAAVSHTFVLVAEVLGIYMGADTYTEAEGRVDVKLQEEAGGEGRYFGSAEGDSVSITVLWDDEGVAWGEFTVSGLGGSDGTITLSPQPLPIWCDEVEQ